MTKLTKKIIKNLALYAWWRIDGEVWRGIWYQISIPCTRPFYQSKLNCVNCRNRNLIYKFCTGMHSMSLSECWQTVSSRRPLPLMKMLNSCFNKNEKIAANMKSPCSMVFACFYYSKSFSNDDFPSSNLRIRLRRRDS